MKPSVFLRIGKYIMFTTLMIFIMVFCYHSLIHSKTSAFVNSSEKKTDINEQSKLYERKHESKTPEKPNVPEWKKFHEGINSITATDSTKNLENKIRDFLGDNVNQIGLVLYNLSNKQTILINENESFIAASTVKVPINIILYDKIYEGKINIEESLEYQDYDYEEGSGILQDLEVSELVPIKTLSDYSIIYSDNIATNMLIDRIGFEEMKEAFEEKLGHPVDHEKNLITPLDAAKFLYTLYENPDKNPYYNVLMEAMKNTIFHDRIDKYIPEDMVAHKIGDYENYINDIGIVFSKEPYILAVYTRDFDEEYGFEVIAQISKMIYEDQVKE